jgi:cytochrome c556
VRLGLVASDAVAVPAVWDPLADARALAAVQQVRHARVAELMPTLRRACPSCRVRTITTGRVCDACRPAYERQRRPSWVSKLYNSGGWQEVRNLKRSRTPICEVCQRARAVEVHHKRSVLEAPHLALDYANLMSVCEACHDQLKQRREQ